MTETEHAEPMAHARAATGVLFFDETGRVLVVDWAPHPDEGDKILFVFDGGLLASEHLDLIKIDPADR